MGSNRDGPCQRTATPDSPDAAGHEPSTDLSPSVHGNVTYSRSRHGVSLRRSQRSCCRHGLTTDADVRPGRSALPVVDLRPHSTVCFVRGANEPQRCPMAAAATTREASGGSRQRSHCRRDRSVTSLVTVQQRQWRSALTLGSQHMRMQTRHGVGRAPSLEGSSKYEDSALAGRPRSASTSARFWSRTAFS